MAEQPNDFMRSLQELITNSASDQIRASRQFNDLVQSIARGELSDREVNEQVRQFLGDVTTRYIKDMSQLTISFFQAMRTVNRHYNDHFYDRVMGAPSTNGHTPEAGNGTLQRVDMTLTAQVGDHVQKAFVIENKQDHDHPVSFAVSEFTAVDGGTSFRAPLQLQPSRFTLRAGSEQVVTLSLELLPELFAPGQQYQGTVLVQGHDNLMLSLMVDVQQAQPSVQIYDAPASPRTAYSTLPADDLTRLKGIGPNYARALARAGIIRFADLAQINDTYLQDQLGNGLFRQAQRYDWRGQARLAAEGNETALARLQALLPLNSRE